jgi:DNA invertase Pin-like site-specific DNA recombinase
MRGVQPNGKTLTARRRILSELGVADDRVYLDHGLTGRNRSRPGLTQALAALREGDTLVVPKLDRLARARGLSKPRLPARPR